jgi:hypothetical protein
MFLALPERRWRWATLVREVRPHLDEAAAVPAGRTVPQVGTCCAQREPALGLGIGGELGAAILKVLGNYALELAGREADRNPAARAIDALTCRLPAARERSAHLIPRTATAIGGSFATSFPPSTFAS